MSNILKLEKLTQLCFWKYIFNSLKKDAKAAKNQLCPHPDDEDSLCYVGDDGKMTREYWYVSAISNSYVDIANNSNSPFDYDNTAKTSTTSTQAAADASGDGGERKGAAAGVSKSGAL